MVVVPSRLSFARRPNSDGTTDSICKNCFTTIATSTREFELAQAEKTHACDPHLLNYWSEMRDRKTAE